MADVGAEIIECGSGFTDMTLGADTVVGMARERGLDVQYELGEKHGGSFADDTVDALIDRGRAWLEAGAIQLVIEARESAQEVGLFDQQGKLNGALADRFAGRASVLISLCSRRRQAEPVRAARPLREQGSALQCPPRGGSTSGDLPPGAPFGRVPSREPPTASPAVKDARAARTVVIDVLAESVSTYRDEHVIVAVDVIRATTTAVTAVSLGFQCFPVASLEHAVPLAGVLESPLLVGELGGNTPYGFDLTNSPAQVTQLTELHRPIILLSSSGTRVMHEAREAHAGYVACLRNYSASARYLAATYNRVAVIGAGTRGEFREEDQLCCAWIARILVDLGFEAERSPHR